MRTRIVLLCMIILVCGFASVQAKNVTVKYQPNWQSLDKRPTPKWWTDAKFGIFIHWGPYSVPAFSKVGLYSEWYWHRLLSSPKRDDGATVKFHNENYGENFDYKDFAPMFKAELFDPDYWAQVFAKSGAKYIVHTSKHHDGFCLWPSKEVNKTWSMPWNCLDVGPKRDLLGELAAAVRKTDVKFGLYYSLYEWYNPLWLSDKERYVTEHMHPQFKDMVTRFKPAVIFSDGEWDLPSKKWKSEELLAWLFNESACRDYVVIDDRWGKETRHKHGGYYTTEYGAGLADADKPWEECRGMAHSFGYSRTEKLNDYKTERELTLILIDLVSRGGNLLLDIGPTADGRIPVIMVERLLQMGKWLDVNGEAIYGTTTWRNTRQWSEGQIPKADYKKHFRVKYDVTKLVDAPAQSSAAIEVFFTAKADTLYAIVPHWPKGKLLLKDITASKNTVVTLLGHDKPLRYQTIEGNLIIDVPELTIDELPCTNAYTFKISGVK